MGDGLEKAFWIKEGRLLPRETRGIIREDGVGRALLAVLIKLPMLGISNRQLF